MDISSITLGKCFTLNSSVFHIGTDIGQHLTFWYPDTNVTQKTLIHDPDFFLNGPNPRAIPRIMSIQNQDYGVKQEFLETVQHVKMNLPASPCQESASYSFTRCVRNYISKKVGCKTEWDYWSIQSRKICRNVGKLIEYEELYLRIVMLERNGIMQHTGCLLPCQYKEFKIVEPPQDLNNQFRMKKLFSPQKVFW